MAQQTETSVIVMFDPTAINKQSDIIGPATDTKAGVINLTQLKALSLSADEHEVLRQLIHFISEGPGHGFASGAFKEVLPIGDPFPSSATWYTSAAKTQKIVEKLIVRNPNKTPSQITWRVYETDGVTVAQTIIDNITYASAVFEATRTRTII